MMSQKRFKDYSTFNNTSGHLPSNARVPPSHPKIKPYLKYSWDMPDDILKIFSLRYRAKQMKKFDVPNILVYLTYTGRNAKYLKKFLYRAKHMKRLAVHYDPSWLTLDTFLPNLFDLFKHLQNLKVLKLNWQKNSNIKGEELYDLLQKRTLSLKRIQHLSLNIDSHSLGWQSIKQVFNTIRKLSQKLDILKLVFNDCQKFDNSYLEGAQKYLKWLNRLQRLDIGLHNNCTVTNDGLNCIALALRRLKKIPKVSLTLENFVGISDKGVGHILRALRLNETLKELTLNFSEHSKLTNTTLGKIKRTLRDLKQLRTLTLNMSSRVIGKGITLPGIEFLSSGLANLKNLQKIDLAFNQCLKLPDKTFPALLKNLNLEILRSMYLSFINCSLIGSEVFKLIQQSVKNGQFPKKLILFLKECGGINNQSLEQLYYFLQTIKTLNFYVGLENCKFIDDQALDILVKFAHLKQIKGKLNLTGTCVTKSKQRTAQTKLSNLTIVLK